MAVEEEADFLMTLGAGGAQLARLAVEELRLLLGAQAIERSGQARIFFRAAVSPVQRFDSLCAAEKVYVIVLRRPAETLSFPSEGAAAEDALAAEIAACSGWKGAVETWKALTQAGTACGDGQPRSFRVSSKRAGVRARHLSSNGISEAVGFAVAGTHGWAVALRDFDVEVVVHLNDESLLVMLPLLERGSARQQCFECRGLSQPVAWAMARSVTVLPGDIVVDPMCGAGIVLLEAAQCWRDAWYLGFDEDEAQLRRLSANMDSLAGRSKRAVSLARADATRLPLPAASVDAIVCDLPFGKQYGTEEGNESLYPAVVAEFRRVLRSDVGRAALLTNQANSQRLAAALTDCATGSWSVTCRRRLLLGYMEAVLFVAVPRVMDVSEEASAASSDCLDVAKLPPESMRLPWEDQRGRASWCSQKAQVRERLQPVTPGQKALRASGQQSK